MVCSAYYVHFFFFFKQKTAYELRISDWSSDVCSSDLPRVRRTGPARPLRRAQRVGPFLGRFNPAGECSRLCRNEAASRRESHAGAERHGGGNPGDRKSVV